MYTVFLGLDPYVRLGECSLKCKSLFKFYPFAVHLLLGAVSLCIMGSFSNLSMFSPESNNLKASV